jgi:Tetratricopeptide repeat
MDDDAEDDDVLPLLTPWHVAYIPSLLDPAGDVWDSFRLVEAVYLLKALSLVSTGSQDGSLSVSMHPLVHAWARDRQDDGEQHQHWLQMGCVMAFAWNEGAYWQAHGRQLQSHIEELTAWEVAKMFAAESPTFVARVLVSCGWLLHAMRADAKLFILTERIFIHLKLDRLKIERPWMGIYDLAARNLLNYGKVKEAVALLENMAKIREQSLAEDHPDRLASEDSLAIYLWELGSHKASLGMMARVVELQRKVLDEGHPYRERSEDWLDYFEHKMAELEPD